MSRTLDLRTGRTVWSAYRAPKVQAEELSHDITTDVVVVGMGISGAMIADAIASSGRRVVLLDRRGPILGSTAATTALVQYEIDQPLSRLALALGRSKAEQAWRRSRLAVANLAGHIDHARLACRASIRPSLYLAGTQLGADALEMEAIARRQAGIGATFVRRAELREQFGIDRPAAILSQGNLSLDPVMLTAAMLLRAKASGARFFDPADAFSVEHSTDGVTLRTKAGPMIKARYAVLATGYELLGMVDAPRHEIISTFAIATARQRNRAWTKLPLIWEASDPYLYLRSIFDGRIICGGEDESFQDEDRRDDLIGTKADILSRKLKQLLPGLETRPEMAWAGSFGTTATGLPYIGPLPRRPRIFAVLGYGGNGITYSRMAAELISNALDGRDDSDASLFAF